MQYKRVVLGGSEPEVLKEITEPAEAQLRLSNGHPAQFLGWNDLENEYYDQHDFDTGEQVFVRKTPEGVISSIEVFSAASSGVPFNGKLYAPLNNDEGYGVMAYDFDTGECTSIDAVKSGSICDISDEFIVTSLSGETMTQSTYGVYRFSDGAAQEFVANARGDIAIYGNYVYYISSGNSCILQRINEETGEIEELTEIGWNHCGKYSHSSRDHLIFDPEWFSFRQSVQSACG